MNQEGIQFQRQHDGIMKQGAMFYTKELRANMPFSNTINRMHPVKQIDMERAVLLFDKLKYFLTVTSDYGAVEIRWMPGPVDSASGWRKATFWDFIRFFNFKII